MAVSEQASVVVAIGVDGKDKMRDGQDGMR
jgi:hypothetical protein